MTDSEKNALVSRPHEALTVAQSGLVERGLALADTLLGQIECAGAPAQLAAPPPIQFDWITIPAGEFLMGSDKQKDPLAQDNEMPQHSLYLPEYQIARYPVTNAQYQVFVAATNRRALHHWENGRMPADMENHPVVLVSWHDARAFCDWASDVTNQTICLPSEAEWEKAARGTDGRIWPWGNEPPTQECCNFDSNVGDTTPVNSYPKGASPYGLLDMAGNVWEWTANLYERYPYRLDGNRENPVGDEDISLRGGSWYGSDYYVRCAFRDKDGPEYQYNSVGFRVVSPGS